jgi:hypothetical protein
MKVFAVLKITTGLSNHRKYVFALSLFTLFISTGIAQSNAIFKYTIPGNPDPLYLNHLVEGDSNHFYTLGYNSIYECFLIKSDENGNIVWQKNLALRDSETYVTPAELSYHNDHIYALLSSNTYVFDSVGFYYEYELAKIDLNGNLIWAKTLQPIDGILYHKPSIDFGINGEIIVASSSNSRIELFSINDDGTTNWIRNLNSDSTESKNPNFDIAVCDNGDIMGCSKAGNNMCFYRLDSTGIPIWSKTILGIYYSHIKSIREISTDLFVACGYNGWGFYTLIDGSGNFISFNRLNGLQEIKNIFPLDNGNFLLLGIAMTYELAFIEINSAGAIVNSHKCTPSTFLSMAYEGVIDLNGHLFIGDAQYIQKLDNDNMMSNECFNYEPTTFSLTGDDPGASPSENNIILHSLTGTIINNNGAHLESSTLELSPGCDLTAGIESPLAANIKVYPTLLTNTESIFVEHEMTGNVQFRIMDINGKMMKQNVLNNSSIPINGLSTGMYVLQITNNENVVYHSKFVVN